MDRRKFCQRAALFFAGAAASGCGGESEEGGELPAGSAPAPSSPDPAPSPAPSPGASPVPVPSAPPSVIRAASIAGSPVAGASLNAAAAEFADAASVTTTLEWCWWNSTRVNSLPFSTSLAPGRAYLNCRWRVRSVAVNALGSTQSTSAWSAPLIGADGRRMLLGEYVGNDPAAALAFDAWLGRASDGVQLHGGYGKGKATAEAAWSDWRASLGWLTSAAGANYISLRDSKAFFFTVPLVPEYGTLAAAASAADTGYLAVYDQHLRTMLADARSDGPIYVRVGWEFNGDWYPWAAAGRSADYIAAFRRFATRARALSARFVIEWNVNCGLRAGDPDPELCYPGDDFVDIVGMDCYVNAAEFSGNAASGFSYQKTRSRGLDWAAAFAAAHGKPYAIGEWGVTQDAAGSDPGAAVVNGFRDFMLAHPDCAYHCYWYSNAAFAGSLASKPLAAQAYKAAFGAV